MPSTSCNRLRACAPGSENRASPSAERPSRGLACGFAQDFSHISVDLQLRQFVGAGHPAVHDGNRHTEPNRGTREAKAGKDHQRRAGDEQELCPFEGGHRRLHALNWHIFTEKYHMRLEDSAAGAASRDVEVLAIDIAELRVAVWSDDGVGRREIRISADQLGLKRRALSERTTSQTANLVEPTMQID